MLAPGAENNEQTAVAPGWRSPSALVLVTANAIPLLGVLLFGWRIGELFLLYWLESAVIGLFNVFKIITINRVVALVLVPFFVLHYGGFMAGHLLFLHAFFLREEFSAGLAPATLLDLLLPLWPAIAAFLVSHAFSYRENFLGRREYLQRTAATQMHEPYRRIIVMHLTILLGGFMAQFFGAPLYALLLMILLKTGVDLDSHRREHRTVTAGRVGQGEEAVQY